MNQSLLIGLDDVMPAAIATGLLSAVVTIQEHDGTLTASGALDPSDANWDDVTGLVDIPCQAAPANPNLMVIADKETRRPTEIETFEDLHCLLDTYYEGISTAMRGILTFNSGETNTFDIQAVEHDSQCKMTRLRLVKVTL